MLFKIFKITLIFLSFIVCYQFIYHMDCVSRINYQTKEDKKITYESQHATIKPEYLSEDECHQILPCLTNGSWSLKDDLSPEDVQKRIKMDEYIYEYQGFPRTFTRSDGRCGRKYPPTPKARKAGSVCDAYSTQPCCNEDKGRCGSTPEYCSCKNCTDFRKYLPAELAQWKTNHDKCRMRDFKHAEACKFFTQHISEMLFVGDSLTRHIFTALALILTNNTAMGALNIKMKPKQREKCSGELQFIDAGKFNCHVSIARRWEELPPVCGGKTNFRINLEEAYNVQLLPRAKNAVRKLLNKTGSVVVLNVGLHMRHNSKHVIDKYVGPIVDMVTNSGNGWPKIIWHNLHGIENFLRSDINELFTKWKRFNAEMSTYLKTKRIAILDSGQLTRGIRSYDARHFGLGGNMLKAQVLINYLEQWFKTCRKYEIRE
ncbi:uncharacterized protein LOC116293082 [Actinia tenebrosa]|uniref:Uncharacterized protein LOC116293082 n=1 Tax=Actinia tenebrosa TaxID=6105 RepID=A0A6P8HMY0_ACTTE|nr:uncharacterized protein LOC116293082 [Actinia tenebrosa]